MELDLYTYFIRAWDGLKSASVDVLENGRHGAWRRFYHVCVCLEDDKAIGPNKKGTGSFDSWWVLGRDSIRDEDVGWRISRVCNDLGSFGGVLVLKPCPQWLDETCTFTPNPSADQTNYPVSASTISTLYIALNPCHKYWSNRFPQALALIDSQNFKRGPSKTSIIKCCRVPYNHHLFSTSRGFKALDSISCPGPGHPFPLRRRS